MPSFRKRFAATVLLHTLFLQPYGSRCRHMDYGNRLVVCVALTVALYSIPTQGARSLLNVNNAVDGEGDSQVLDAVSMQQITPQQEQPSRSAPAPILRKA
jgi:hypothetical protein